MVASRLDQALVDVALVQFGVAQQADHPSLPFGRQRATRCEVVLRQRSESRHRHSKPDGAGREVHVVRVNIFDDVERGAQYIQCD